MENTSMENKIKHLEMIESIIERMGNNSFQLKGWAVTLVTVIGVFSATGSDKRFFIIAFIPLVAFWAIDAFYLQSERKYKELYKKVRAMKEEEIDFDMDTSAIKTKRTVYWNCLLSRTEACFYGPITVAVLVLAIVLKVW